MATVLNPNEENTYNQPQNGINPPQGGANPVSLNAGGAGQVAPGVIARNAQPAGTGSKFQGLRSFLGANQGEAQKLGGAAAGVVQKQGQQANQNIQKTQTGIQGQVTNEQNRLNQAGQYANTIKAAGQDQPLQQGSNIQTSPQLGTNTQALQSLTDKNFNDIQQLRNAQFQNQDISNLGDLQANIDKTKELANLTQNQAGRGQLLKQGLGLRNYSGQANLSDQLLLGTNNQALNQAKQTGLQTAQEASGNLGNLQTFTQAQNEQLKNTALEKQGLINTSLDEANKGVLSSVDKQVAALNAEDQKRQQVGTGIRDILAGNAKKADGSAYSKDEAIQQALQMGLDNKLINESDMSNIGQAIKKLNTPVQSLIRQVTNTDKGGYLGYGAKAGSSTSITPGSMKFSDLDMRDLLNKGLNFQTAAPATREQAINKDQFNRLQALSKLSQRNSDVSQMSDFQKSQLGFNVNDINRKVDEDIARLNNEKLIDIGSVDLENADKLRRTLTPTAAEASTDSQQDIAMLANSQATPEQRAMAIAKLSAAPQRAMAGEGIIAGQNAMADVNSSVNNTFNPNTYKDPLNANVIPTRTATGNITSAQNLANSVPGISNAMNAPLPGGSSINSSIDQIRDIMSQGSVMRTQQAAAQKAAADAAGYKKMLENAARDFGSMDAAKEWASNQVSGIGNTLSNIFCHLGGLLVDMADGSKKLIQDLKVGDETCQGGKILFFGSTIATDLVYNYQDVLVTAKHAVKENNVWVRVENSREAIVTDIYKPVVYFFETENHIFIANGIVWADFFESENHSLSNDESLNELNIGK